MYTFREFYIPERMMGGIERWINHGIRPGSFLTAVLENNLVGAVSQADDENIRNLPAYVGYLYNEVDSMCWGSVKKVEEWEEYHIKLREENESKS